MHDISLKGNINLDNKVGKTSENEFFSLKFIDNLYKKDIGKFLEILSYHFI